MYKDRVKILGSVKDKTAYLEPWPGYFDYRFIEFDVLWSFLKKDIKRDFKQMKVLEIGTGIGLVSGFLADVFKEVVTIDLPEQSGAAHSLGAQKINDFFEKNAIERVSYYPADARDLSLFPDNSFDAVYSSQVLEHIPVADREQVLQEMKRILKKDGLVITVVPNFMERVYQFFYYYFSLFTRLAKLWRRKNQSAHKDHQAHVSKSNVSKKSLWSKLVLPPHGFYQSSSQEFIKHLPQNWVKLFNNFFTVTNIYTNKLSVPLSTPFFLKVYQRNNKLDKFLGRIKPFKFLGRTLVVIAVNNK